MDIDDFKTRINNLLYDLTYKIDDKDLKNLEFNLKRLEDVINIKYKKNR